MKILHQTGHNANWNLDSVYKDKVGDGFIFCAFNIESSQISSRISTYGSEKFLPISMIDLQFYGNKESKDLGKFHTYDFHPANRREGDTVVGVMESIEAAIDYQINSGFQGIIIPSVCEDRDGIDIFSLIKKANDYLNKTRDKNHQYFMTIPITPRLIHDPESIEKLLLQITHQNICFDGYYIVCDSSLEYRRKVSEDFDYYEQLSRVFKVLKKNDFQIIYGYSNFDSLVFASVADIDYITIATYENLKNFNLRRYKTKESGGPSKGWYFSEKLLGIVQAQFITRLRVGGALELIKNEKNIYSDIILDQAYPWSIQKPDQNKNYLVAISHLLREISLVDDKRKRINLVLQKIDRANNILAELENKSIYLQDESAGHHLPVWKSFLTSQLDKF